MLGSHQTPTPSDDFWSRLSFQVTKPLWLVHTDDKSKRKSIFCLDVHPQVPLLATGCIDSTIKLWNVTSCAVEEAACLATLSRHTGAILALKWSPNGKFLASGSDDRMLVVWHSVDNGPFTAFKILTNHSSDVTDVVWSERALISCGIDNVVYVFDSERFTVLAKVPLTGVGKGLCVDPLGSFVACQLENALVVLRTSDWGIEKNVQKMSQDYSGAFFLRPSWCPDGSLVAVSGGYNQGSGSSCWLFQRDTWTVGGCLVGHQGSVECSKFSPVLYAPIATTQSQLALESCIGVVAVGSQDGSISLWTNSNDTPVVVLWNLFSHSILDIAWTASGDKFYACSFDGSVVEISLRFPDGCRTIDKERILPLIGVSNEPLMNVPLSAMEIDLKNHAIERQLIVSKPKSPHDLGPLSEPSINLQMLTQNLPSSQGLTSTTSKEIPAETLETLREQKVQQTKGGKKRITPQFVRAIDTFVESVSSPSIPTTIKRNIIADYGLNLYSSTADEKPLLPSYEALILDPLTPQPTNIHAFKRVEKNFDGMVGNTPSVATSDKEKSISLTAQNIPKSPNNRITVQHSDNVIWTHLLHSNLIQFIDFNEEFLIFTTTNNTTLYVLSTRTGRVLFPKIILPTDIHRITLLDDCLVAVFVDGEFIGWNLRERILLFKSSIQKYFQISKIKESNHKQSKKLSLITIELTNQNLFLYFNNNSKLIYNYSTMEMIIDSIYNQHPGSVFGLQFIKNTLQTAEQLFDVDSRTIIQESLQDIEEKMSASLLVNNLLAYKQYCVSYLNLLCSAATNDATVSLKLQETIGEITRLFSNQTGGIDRETAVDLLSIPVHYGKKRDEIEEVMYKYGLK